MKALSKTIILICLSSSLLGQSIPKNSIFCLEGKEYTKQELSEGTGLFLVSSLTCGFCLNEIPFYNHIAETYSTSKNIRFVVLLDNNQKYINEYKSLGKLFYNEHWIVSSKSMSYIKKIWIKKTFPEYHIYINGKFKKSFAYANDETRKALTEYLKSL